MAKWFDKLKKLIKKGWDKRKDELLDKAEEEVKEYIKTQSRH